MATTRSRAARLFAVALVVVLALLASVVPWRPVLAVSAPELLPVHATGRPASAPTSPRLPELRASDADGDWVGATHALVGHVSLSAREGSALWELLRAPHASERSHPAWALMAQEGVCRGFPHAVVAVAAPSCASDALASVWQLLEREWSAQSACHVHLRPDDDDASLSYSLQSATRGDWAASEWGASLPVWRVHLAPSDCVDSARALSAAWRVWHGIGLGPLSWAEERRALMATEMAGTLNVAWRVGEALARLLEHNAAPTHGSQVVEDVRTAWSAWEQAQASHCAAGRCTPTRDAMDAAGALALRLSRALRDPRTSMPASTPAPQDFMLLLSFLLPLTVPTLQALRGR